MSIYICYNLDVQGDRYYIAVANITFVWWSASECRCEKSEGLVGLAHKVEETTEEGLVGDPRRAGLGYKTS